MRHLKLKTFNNESCWIYQSIVMTICNTVWPIGLGRQVIIIEQLTSQLRCVAVILSFVVSISIINCLITIYNAAMLRVMDIFMHHMMSVTNLNSHLYAKSDFIRAMINFIEQKIFSSDESRNKLDFDFKTSYWWWIRSTRMFLDYCTSGISCYGIVSKFAIYDYNDVAPVCMIWKPIQIHKNRCVM